MCSTPLYASLVKQRIDKKVKAHMAHVSQKKIQFHITKIRTLSKVKVIQCNVILKVWPTGYLLFKLHNTITNKKCQYIVKQEVQSPYGSRVSEKLEFYIMKITTFSKVKVTHYHIILKVYPQATFGPNFMMVLPLISV